jgi:hypothetical protein
MKHGAVVLRRRVSCGSPTSTRKFAGDAGELPKAGDRTYIYLNNLTNIINLRVDTKKIFVEKSAFHEYDVVN